MDSMGRKVTYVLRGLIAAYVITGAVLAGLAFLVYRFELSEQITDLAIVAVYVIVTVIGGFITGKKMKTHRFMWGFILGIMYIGILYGIAILLSQTLHVCNTTNITTIILCIGGGTVGGMLSQ